MCGIAGLTQPNTPEHDLMQGMGNTMKNRGPDDVGYFIQDGIGVVHRRLSIIDLSNGKQPIWNENQTTFIICNGEIYDYHKHREQLEQLGHKFSTNSDSEVLLHLYEEYGTKMLEYINGMFAFAIVDPSNNEFFIARDRLGQKPLFYTSNTPSPQHFAFASGPSALKVIPWINLGIDHLSMHHLLEYQYIPQPRSIYTDIKKLLPGHFLLWKSGHLTLKQYWAPPIPIATNRSDDELAEQAAAILKKAVKRRLVADVKVGSFLSGGMDSSIVSLLAAQQSNAPLTTLSIGFPETKYDESAYASQVATHIHSEHISQIVNPDDINLIDTLATAFEEPFADASMLPTYLLCQLAKEHVTVALSGDGADELFGGYERYNIIRHLQSPLGKALKIGSPLYCALRRLLPPKTEERTIAGKLQRLLEILPLSGLQQYLTLISRFPESDRFNIYTEEHRARLSDSCPLSPLTDYMGDRSNLRHDIDRLELGTYLPGDILTKVDRSSMAHGLEVRSPFLDVEVIEFAMSLPLDIKMRHGQRKHLLNMAFGKQLPSAITKRAKMGFGVPLARWMRNEWKAPLRERLLDGVLNNHGYNQSALESYINCHLGNKADNSYGLFALMMLESWLRQHVQ